MTQLPLYSTPGQVADYLTEAGIEISEDAVRRWCRTKQLVAITLPGGQWRIHRDDVAALLARPTSAASSP